ncbi:MAG: TrkA family potassium uptake protein [Oscillospiraceae bacterium]|nr:TrkA family potassium uptake protein [Oscillospiraceae bacterium]
MKTALIIGTGHFGSHLAERFSELGNEVMIVDSNEDNMKRLLPYVTSAQVGDCTDESVLKGLGIKNFDICFVCIGDSFQSSLEVTSLLKDMGAELVVSRATDEIHAKFLLKNGADSVIYPERDTALRIAARYTANNVVDYFGLSEDVSIYEIPVHSQWAGSSVRDLDFRANYQVNILATKKDGKMELLLSGDHVLREDEHLLVIGYQDQLQKFLKRID